jgi:hypothetical protein
MRHNVGKTERLARLAAGTAILSYGLLKKKKWVDAVAAIPLVTGLIKYCPVNEMLGINVLSTPQKKAAKREAKRQRRMQADSDADKSFHFTSKRAEGEDDTGGYRTGKARKS